MRLEFSDLLQRMPFIPHTLSFSYFELGLEFHVTISLSTALSTNRQTITVRFPTDLIAHELILLEMKASRVVDHHQ